MTNTLRHRAKSDSLPSICVGGELLKQGSSHFAIMFAGCPLDNRGAHAAAANLTGGDLEIEGRRVGRKLNPFLRRAVRLALFKVQIRRRRHALLYQAAAYIDRPVHDLAASLGEPWIAERLAEIATLAELAPGFAADPPLPAL